MPDIYTSNLTTAKKDPYLSKVSSNARYTPSVKTEDERLYTPDMPDGVSIGSLFRQLDINAVGPSAQQGQYMQDMSDYLTGMYMNKSAEGETLSPDDKIFASMLMSSMTGRETTEILGDFDRYSEAFTGIKTNKNFLQNWGEYFSGHWDRKEITNATMLLTEIPYDSPRRQYYEKYRDDLQEAYAKKTANVSTKSGVLRNIAQSGDIMGQTADQLMRAIELGLIGSATVALMASGVGAPAGVALGTTTGLAAIQAAQTAKRAYAVGSTLSSIQYTVNEMAKAEGAEIADRLMSMVDERGNRIPLDIVKRYAYTGGLLSAITELSDNAITPIGSLKFGTKTVGEFFKHTKQMVEKSAVGYLGLFAGNTALQIGQEGLQGWIREKFIDDAVKSSNESGATNFADYQPKSASSDTSWDVFMKEAVEALPSLVITGAVGAVAGGVGAYAYAGASYVTKSLERKMQLTPQMKSDAAKYFNENGKVYDIGYIDTVGEDGVDHYEPKKGEDGKTPERKKAAPIFLYVNKNTGALVPVYRRDRQYVEYLRENGVTGVKGIIVSEEALNAAGNVTSAYRLSSVLAMRLGEDAPVMGYDGETIIMETQDGVEAAIEDIQNYKNAFSENEDTVEVMKQEDGSYRIVWENARGGNQTITIRAKNETDQMFTEATEETEATGNVRPVRKFEGNAMKDMFNSSIRKSKEETLQDEEVEMAAKFFYKQLTGLEEDEFNRLWGEDYQSIIEKLPEGVDETVIEEGARFMPLLSAVTGRSIEDLLGDTEHPIVLNYTGEAKKVIVDGVERSVRGEFGTQTNKKTKKREFVINLSNKADQDGADTLVHELMHLARRMASKERLEGFKKAYGQDDLWYDDIKEVDGKYVFNGKQYDTRRQAEIDGAAYWEERFVQDFFTYLKTGQAPNAEVATFFGQLKQFLQSFLNTYNAKLSDDTKRAFEKLLNGEVDVQPGQSVEQAVEGSERTLTDEQETPLNSLSSEAQRQYDEVVAKYKGTDQWLKAPNGKDTNLTERQWVMVRTPNFIRWFGDWINDPDNSSKVVDENGEPMVMYHGTLEHFDVFDTGRTGQNWRGYASDGVGAYFTSSFESAENWAEKANDRTGRKADEIIVEPVFLNIRNPYGKSISADSFEFGYDAWDDLTGGRKSLADFGYDGNFHEVKGYGVYDAVTTAPNQIKSATDNNGEFSNENDSILYSLADDKQWQIMDANTQRRIDADYEYVRNQYYGTDKWMKAPNGQPTKLTERQWIQVRTPAFKAWFGDWENDPENSSRVLDENGEPKVVYHGATASFTVFSRTSDMGYHFGTEAQAIEAQTFHYNNEAPWFGTADVSEGEFPMMELFLNLRNPVTGIEDPGTWTADNWQLVEDLRDKGFISDFQYKWLERMYEHDDLFNRNGDSSRMTKYLKDALVENGYDGIIYKNMFEAVGGDFHNPTYDDSYMVFNSNQVKSATDNSGEFDPENDSILFSLAEIADTEADYGLYVNNSTAEHFADLILDGVKTIETRTRRSLQNLLRSGVKVGDRIGIVSNGQLMGYVTLSDVREYANVGEFNKDFEIRDANENVIGGHFVNGGKYGYDEAKGKVGLVFSDPERISPVKVTNDGNRIYTYLNSIADEDGNIKITSEVETMYEEAKARIPKTSPWASTLFSLEAVTANVKTTYANTANVTYQVSMQEGELEKFLQKDWKEADFKIESLEQARQINTNPERVKDWQTIYKAAMERQIIDKKTGEQRAIQWGDWKKKASSGKVFKVPCIDLSIGCQRIRTVIERVANGIMPHDTVLESCYGGDCFVNNDMGHMFDPEGKKEGGALKGKNVDTQDLGMATPTDIDNWFADPKFRKFLQSSMGFIRMGFIGDCSHSFPILDGYNESLAEAWLRNIVKYDIKNPVSGKYMRTIFITAGYAPVTQESYERLVPYKDLFVVHVSTSGWFTKNENLLRLAEFDVMNRLGLKVMIRNITDKNGISRSTFNNSEWLKDYVFNVMKMRQNQILATAFHDDKSRKHSDMDTDYKYQCCVTGQCVSCKVGCGSRIDLDAPEGTSFQIDDDYIGKEVDATVRYIRESDIKNKDAEDYTVILNREGKMVSTLPASPGTSTTPQIQPQDNVNGRTANAGSQELQMASDLEANNRTIEDLAKENDLPVVEFDGVKYIKHSNDDYTDDELRAIKDSVSATLHSIQPEFDFSGQLELDFSGNQGNGQTATLGQAGNAGGGAGAPAADLRGLRPGVAQYFDWATGWNGQEPSSFIDGQWDNLGYISFIGTELRSPEDIAKLYSVYRNPKLEYSHTIFMKGDTVVGHMALSTGVPNSAYAVPTGGMAFIRDQMARIGADGYYMMHNHPSGDVSFSSADKKTSNYFRKEIPGFRGHIILDHNRFGFFDENMHFTERDIEGMHEASVEKLTANATETFNYNPGSFVSAYAMSFNKPTFSVMYTDYRYRVVDIEDFDSIPTRNQLNQKMKTGFYSFAIGITSDAKMFQDMKTAIHSAYYANKPRYNFSDVVYFNPENGNFWTIKREIWSDELNNNVWGSVKGVKNRSGEAFIPKFNRTDDTGTLYSLSPERQSEILKARKDEIRRAVEAGIFVSTEYLDEFRGEDWVQAELDFRDWLKENPDIVSLARNADTFNDFKTRYEKRNDSEEDEDIPFSEEGLFETEEDQRDYDEWLHRIYEYAHAPSMADLDRRFAEEWTSSEDKTLELAKYLRSYMDAAWKSKPNSRSGGYWYTKNVYNSFKGVSQKVRNLQDGKGKRTSQRERSSSEEIQAAQELIRQNPRPYRNAYMLAMMGESRAADVQMNMRNIGESADWMKLEIIDDDIAQELERIEAEDEAKKSKGIDYTTDPETLRRKGEDAETDLRKSGESTSSDAKELKAKLAEAERKVKDLEDEIREAEAGVDEIIERMGSRIEELSEQARSAKGMLRDRRARVKELKERLSEANKEKRRLSNALNALRRWKEAKEESDYRRKRIRQIRRLSTFNDASLDAIFEETFDWVAALFDRNEDDMETRRELDQRISDLKQEIEKAVLGGEDAAPMRETLRRLQNMKKQSRFLEPPAQLQRYLPQGYTVRADNRPSRWTSAELDTLLRAIQLMRMDAKAMLQDKKNARMAKLMSTAYGYFKQSLGYDAPYNEAGEMSSRELGEEVASLPDKTFGTAKEKWLGYHLYKLKIQRIARIIDGYREGIAYNWFVRRNWRCQTAELKGIDERLDLGEAKWKDLGLKRGELSKEGFKGTKLNGTEYSLTRGQMIGVYVYAQSELGYEKLTSIHGNAFSEDDVKAIMSQLTDKERAWADFMLEEMQSNYGRLAQVYYNVWNRNLGQRPAYFPLVASEAHTMEPEDTDFLCSQTSPKDGKAFVDKGFTKDVNPNAIYPLKLDVTATWNQQVRRQEHFIAYGEWSRDTQYLMDKGQMGKTIEKAYGPQYRKMLQKQVDHVISNLTTTGTDFDRTITKYFSARNAAALTASVSTALKQLGSIGAIFENEGDIGKLFTSEGFLRNFLKANAELNAEYGDVRNVREFIYANAPDIRNRQIDFEVMAYLNRVYGGAVSNAIQQTTGKIMKYTTNLMDRLVVERLWLARYYTEFENQKAAGKTVRQAHAEAVFKASQLISETQPTSMRMDQSAQQIEAQKSTLLRMVSVFTNQAMNLSNMIMSDWNYARKRHDWRKVVGVTAAVLVNTLSVALISGRFIKKGGEDDDKYRWRLMREILGTVAQLIDPVWGGNLLQGLTTAFGGSNYMNEFTDLGSVIRVLTTPSDRKTAWEKIADALEDIAGEVLNVMGIPGSNIVKKPLKAIEEGNAGYLLNNAWGEIIESYR